MSSQERAWPREVAGSWVRTPRAEGAAVRVRPPLVLRGGAGSSATVTGIGPVQDATHVVRRRHHRLDGRRRKGRTRPAGRARPGLRRRSRTASDSDPSEPAGTTRQALDHLGRLVGLDRAVLGRDGAGQQRLPSVEVDRSDRLQHQHGDIDGHRRAGGLADDAAAGEVAGVDADGTLGEAGQDQPGHESGLDRADDLASTGGARWSLVLVQPHAGDCDDSTASENGRWLVMRTASC